MSFSEHSPRDNLLLDQEKSTLFLPPNPFARLSIVSRTLFGWVIPLVKLSQHRTIDQTDVFELSQKDSSDANFEKFQVVFEEVITDSTIKNPIQTTFYKVYKREIITTIILNIVQIAGNLVKFKFTSLLLTAFNGEERGKDFLPLVPALIALVLTFIILSIVRSNYNFYNSILSIRMTGALSKNIFQKSLKFAILRNQTYKVGDILNMIQVDILQCIGYTENLIQIITAVPLLAVTIIMVKSSLQQTSLLLIIIACAIFFLLGSLVFGRFYGAVQKKFMDRKDQRMRFLEEMLRGIKTIKYNSYENFFDNRISEKRNAEVKELGKQNFLTIFNKFFMSTSNSVVIGIVSLLVGISNFPEFLMISNSFSTIQATISVLPAQIKSVVVGYNSLLRLADFFKDSFVFQHLDFDSNESQTSIGSVVLNKAQFSWKKNNETPQTQQDQPKSTSFFQTGKLNFTINKGEFVVFYGPIGSGKSSILQGILGETDVEGGEESFQNMVQVHGKLSICSQEPWIIQDTVKENIVFEQTYSSSRYENTLVACCLTEDISYFVDGDMTVVGEKGETLSGGQRKRINLARAVYRDADIYLLDDPLGALDISVANHIVNECLNGMLASKTRIVFTSTLLGMEKSDRIFVLENGKILNSTTYNELCSGDSNFENQKLSERKESLQSNQLLKYLPDSIQNINKNERISDNHYTKRLIQNEDIQRGTISRSVYKQLYQFLGNHLFLLASPLAALFVFFNTETCLIMKNVQNIEQPTEEQMQEQNSKILTYCFYDFFRVVSILLCDCLLVVRMLSVSKYLHQSTVFHLLRGSFTRFYNLITTGRVMNRLSKDIYSVDIYIPQDLLSLFNQFGTIIVLTILTITIFNIRVFPVYVAYIIISVYLSIYFLRVKRQIVRIEAFSKSPILQYLSEMIRGIVYVRNCVDTQILSRVYSDLVDVDIRNQIVLNGVQFFYEGIIQFLNMFPILISAIILV